MKDTFKRIKKYLWRVDSINIIAAILFGIWAVQDFFKFIGDKSGGNLFGLGWNLTFCALFISYWICRDSEVKTEFTRFIFTIIWSVGLLILLGDGIITHEINLILIILVAVLFIASMFMIKAAWVHYNKVLFRHNCPGKPDCQVPDCTTCPHFKRLMKYAPPRKIKRQPPEDNIIHIGK